LIAEVNPCDFEGSPSAMDDLMPPPPGLSPVGGKLVVARFDGGCLSSDAGVLVLREIEQRLGVAERLAGCIDDPRAKPKWSTALPR
jgi:Transposase DDE domain group 1